MVYTEAEEWYETHHASGLTTAQHFPRARVWTQQWCVKHLEYGPGALIVHLFVLDRVSQQWPLLSWTSLDISGWPQVLRTTRLWLPRAGIKALHHSQLLLQFWAIGVPIGALQVGSQSLVNSLPGFQRGHLSLRLHVKDNKCKQGMKFSWYRVCLACTKAWIWSLTSHELVTHACNPSTREVDVGGSKFKVIPSHVFDV